MKAAQHSISEGWDDEDITKKTCPECEGEGSIRVETLTRYVAKTCGWCNGSGRVPMSGTFKAQGWTRA
jgi:DnaJ-class molecular chaperone